MELNDIQSLKDFIEKNLHSNEINDHRLLTSLRDWYYKLLVQWRLGSQFDESTFYVFENLSNLFLKISHHVTEKNLKDLLFYEPIVEQLNQCLEEIVSHGKYLKDPGIRSLDHFLRTLQRLDYKSSKLFDNVVKCICSSSFIEIFTQSSTSQDTIEDAGQRFLLHTCTDYIYSRPTDQDHRQCFLDIRQALLQPFSHWLTQQSASFRLWNTRMSVILRQLCFILTFSIQNQRSTQFDRQILDYYCQLIDSFINILYSILQLDSHFINNKLAQSLLATITSNLSTIIYSNQLEKYLKSKHITSIIVKLIEFDHEEIQINAFRILSAILTEQDTKNSINTQHLTSLFIKSLNQTVRCSNVLNCLKNVINYDSIKDEFTKQNGVSLILRCITDTNLKPFQILQPALEILLSLTFHIDAYQQLKANLYLIKALTSSAHQRILLAIDCLLWRLEKQDEILLKNQTLSTKTTYQYDLMISYSHTNKEFIHRIVEQLSKENYRIWFDQNETIESPMSFKANIIDQSHYTLICISDEYKLNPYCRAEASYAHQSQYKTIPLILTSNLHPDGWLLDLTQGKIYIDFIKLDFDLAYSTLKSEINRDEFYSFTEPTTTTTEIVPYVTQSDKIVVFNDFSPGIKHWTTDRVRSFIVEHNLECLLPIVSSMSGDLLYDLYTMCKENRESMFHTLKNELSILNQQTYQPLTIFNYLKFLQEIDKYHLVE